jgi:hypothetical protein
MSDDIFPMAKLVGSKLYLEFYLNKKFALTSSKNILEGLTLPISQKTQNNKKQNHNILNEMNHQH